MIVVTVVVTKEGKKEEKNIHCWFQTNAQTFTIILYKFSSTGSQYFVILQLFALAELIGVSAEGPVIKHFSFKDVPCQSWQRQTSQTQSVAGLNPARLQECLFGVKNSKGISIYAADKVGKHIWNNKRSYLKAVELKQFTGTCSCTASTYTAFSASGARCNRHS